MTSGLNRLCILFFLVLSFGILSIDRVMGQTTVFSSGPSKNPEIRRMEDMLADMLKKGKPAEKADSLYDVGKASFDEREYDRARFYFDECLRIESGLNRFDQLIDVYVCLSRICTVQGKNDEALGFLKKALTVAEDNKSNVRAQAIIGDMGVLASRMGRLDEALSYYQVSFKLAQRDDNVASQMASLINQATILKNQKNFEKAHELLTEALKLSTGDEGDTELGQALINIAAVKADMGKIAESSEIFKRAIKIFKESLETVKAAQASFSLAENCYDFHEFLEARNYYQQAADELKDEPPGELLAECYIGMGTTEADLGNFEAASKAHARGLDIAKKCGSKKSEIRAMLQLGNDFLLQGYAEAALHKLIAGENVLTDNVPVETRGSYLIGIGRCYKALGQNDLALKYYQSALKLFNDCADKERVGLTLNTMAVLALDTGDFKNFNDWSEKAKAIYKELDDNRQLAILDYNVGQYNLTRFNYAEAKNNYLNALAKIKLTEDKVTQMVIEQGLGLCELFLNQPDKALERYSDSVKIAEKSGSVEFLWESKFGLGVSLKRLGRMDDAVKNLKEAVELVERQRGVLTLDTFKLGTLDMKKECFIELVDAYVKLNKPYEALEIAEKGRSRAFLDMLAGRRSGVERLRLPISYQGEPDTNAAPKLVARVQPVEPGSRAVNAIPRASRIFTGSEVASANAAAPDIPEIKKLVAASRSTVVEYFQTYNQVMVWVIDPDTNIHMLPPIPVSETDMRKATADLYEAITSQPKNKEEVEALGRRRQDLLKEMYMKIIAPLESHLPKDENAPVTIIPHGVLFQVPFAALMSPDGKFLVEKHTISYTPAIGVLRATQKLEETARSMPNKLMAFGNPITKAIAFLGTLPYSEKEVKNIATIFGAERSVVLIGEDANKPNFFKLAPQYSDLHLATHGLIDEENPMDSSLVLAPTASDDGLLSVKDILSMKEIRARLVVLSACQTGRGKITGDGVVGLSRAFIIAGTPSVMVSQWNVDDIMTEFQMKRFYEQYLQGKTKASALRQAQLATIKFMEGGNLPAGRRANPRYWAAFQLMGEAH